MKLALTAFATAAVAACAASAAPPLEVGPPDAAGCFSSDRILSHRIVDERTLHVETDRRAVFRVTMANSCLQSATSSAPLAVLQVGGSRVCKAKDLDLMVRGRRCIAATLEKLTPEAVAALPAKARP